MTRPSLRFRLPSKVSDRAVIELLRGACEVQVAEVVKTDRAYLDTHDWRVLRGGWTLHLARDRSGGASLVLSEAVDDLPVAERAGLAPPEWASDLPGGEAWGAVASAIGQRRLLRRLQVDATSRRFAVLDDESKTRARVQLERHAVRTEEGRTHHLRLVTVSPVRGYEPDARRICKVLSDAGFGPQRGSLVGLAGEELAVTGERNEVEGARDGRAEPVALTVRRILASLREEVVANEPGVRDQVDIEFLHEYRVASRRARSVLKQVGELFPSGSATRVSDELRWLGTITGPARDLDVQLTQADHAADGLQGLRRLLQRKRAEAQTALVAALDSARYQALIKSWQEMEAAAGDASTKDPGAEPAGPAADRYLDLAHRRVLRIGKTIDDASPAEDLHDLRKKTKGLRYMLELFGPLYPESQLKPAIRELKALQDNLGEFQDGQVQAATIRATAEEMVIEGTASASELMAMGLIADKLDARQNRARAEFTARFERFASQQVTRRYRSIFRTSQGSP